MKNIPILFLTLLTCSAFGQQEKLTLINNKDSSQVKNFRLGSTLEIEISFESIDTTNIIPVEKVIRGKLIEILPSEIVIEPESEKFDYVDTIEGSRIIITKSREFPYPAPNLKIPVKDISSIVDLKRYNAINIIFSFVAVTSLLTPVTIAPMSSISFRNGTFDKKRYYTISAIGIGTFIGSIVVYIPLASNSPFSLGKKHPSDWQIR